MKYRCYAYVECNMAQFVTKSLLKAKTKVRKCHFTTLDLCNAHDKPIKCQLMSVILKQMRTVCSICNILNLVI